VIYVIYLDDLIVGQFEIVADPRGVAASAVKRLSNAREATKDRGARPQATATPVS
jgi:hypothetical protein